MAGFISKHNEADERRLTWVGKVDANILFVPYLRSQHQAAALSAAAAAAAAAAAQHHDFGYSHDFSPKAAPAVPTYKWMQVKRNVPKPGKTPLPGSGCK